MKCAVKNPQPITSVDRMEDGDLAEIIHWSACGELQGRVVQRYKDGLTLIGAKSGMSWSTFFESSHSSIVVRLLKPGDQISVLAE